MLLLQEVKLVPVKHGKAIQLLKSIGYADVAINSIEGQRGVLLAVKPLFPLPLKATHGANPLISSIV